MLIIHTKTQSHKDFAEEEITALIVDTAVKLHKKLGPGLLESVY